MDKTWRGVRSEVPWVDRRPTELIREHVRLTLQPFDERFERMVAWQARSQPEASRADLEAATLAYMSTMPAWRDHPRVTGALS